MPMFGLFGFGIFFMLIWIFVMIFAFVFWIWMLIDAATREFEKDIDKVVWILVIVFLNLLGALIYYLVVKMNSSYGSRNRYDQVANKKRLKRDFEDEKDSDEDEEETPVRKRRK